MELVHVLGHKVVCSRVYASCGRRCVLVAPDAANVPSKGRERRADEGVCASANNLLNHAKVVLVNAAQAHVGGKVGGKVDPLEAAEKWRKEALVFFVGGNVGIIHPLWNKPLDVFKNLSGSKLRMLVLEISTSNMKSDVFAGQKAGNLASKTKDGVVIAHSVANEALYPEIQRVLSHVKVAIKERKHAVPVVTSEINNGFVRKSRLIRHSNALVVHRVAAIARCLVPSGKIRPKG